MLTFNKSFNENVSNEPGGINATSSEMLSVLLYRYPVTSNVSVLFKLLTI